LGGRRGRLISASDRKTAIELIEEAKGAGAREFKACEVLEIDVRTLQRWRKAGEGTHDGRRGAQRSKPVGQLTDEEIKVVLDTVNHEEFKSLPPSQIVPTLADRGIYIASESTFYRILRKHNLQHHRGKSKKPSIKPLSTHKATGPNQVWMWDITWLPGAVKGLYYYLYLILDLYSRKIVGWEIWGEETAGNAAILVRKAAMSEGIVNLRHPLVLHSDNGSPMKGATLLETLYQLGITPSRSRPRVSNDNPYAESIFRTCKYRPNYPIGGFVDLDEARNWVLGFVRWYNKDHRHSGLNFLTPEQRHTGQYKEILIKRKVVYEAAKALHPERWKNKTRNWTIPDEVYLNPEKSKPCEKSTAKGLA
jgi:putative transposase